MVNSYGVLISRSSERQASAAASLEVFIDGNRATLLASGGGDSCVIKKCFYSGVYAHFREKNERQNYTLFDRDKDQSPRDVGLIPGLRRSPGVGYGNPLQFLPGKSHGQTSLAGYSAWGRKESDMIEQLTLFYFSIISDVEHFFM